MSLWQQLVQLLSETPGNVVYHLVTLFAIQAILATSLWQWRRARADGQESGLASRLTIMASILLVMRLLLVILSLILTTRPDHLTALRILPPLEQINYTLTALVIVWGISPPIVNLPRLNHAIALITGLLFLVIYLFFAQNWAIQANTGIPYNSSTQATFWGIVQISILTIGALVTLLIRRPNTGYRLTPLLILLTAHIIHFWDQPESIINDTEIAFWIRMGQLIAFPLIAILAYRHTLYQLIISQPGRLTLDDRPTIRALQHATQMINLQERRHIKQATLQLIKETTSAHLIGLATFPPHETTYLNIHMMLNNHTTTWGLTLSNWPAFRLALEQRQTIEITADSLGAQQLTDLYREMGMSERGPLLIEPLLVNQNPIGLLFVGGNPTWAQWPHDLKFNMPHLATFITRALVNKQTYEHALEDVAPMTPSAEEFVTGRIITLEKQLQNLDEDKTNLTAQLHQATTRAATERQRARDLAATLQALEQTDNNQHTNQLKQEIELLREALIEAEEAMAMAAASESGLSTDWVVTTISRYSGELEEAQIHISQLEQEIARREPQQFSQVITSLAQELRTPLTSIEGYSDLLLGSTIAGIGQLDIKQRNLLQRVKGNSERMRRLLDQMVQFASQWHKQDNKDQQLIDIQEVVETALSTILTEVRRKGLNVNLNIADNIPPVPAKRDDLCQVLVHLLSNASQAALDSAIVTIEARLDSTTSTTNGQIADSSFLHLSVIDQNGGIRPEDLPHVFDPQYQADNPLIVGLGDTGAGLAVAHTIVTASGGRMWIDSELGQGSTFSVLLPTSANGGDGP